MYHIILLVRYILRSTFSKSPCFTLRVLMSSLLDHQVQQITNCRSSGLTIRAIPELWLMNTVSEVIIIPQSYLMSSCLLTCASMHHSSFIIPAAWKRIHKWKKQNHSRSYMASWHRAVRRHPTYDISSMEIGIIGPRLGSMSEVLSRRAEEQRSRGAEEHGNVSWYPQYCIPLPPFALLIIGIGVEKPQREFALVSK